MARKKKNLINIKLELTDEQLMACKLEVMSGDYFDFVNIKSVSELFTELLSVNIDSLVGSSEICLDKGCICKVKI